MNLKPTSTKEIIEIVKSKNSGGYDEIPVKVLKLSLPFIIPPLIYIRNKSLLEGIFPTWLKFSQIIPVLKKGKNQTYQTTDQFPYFLFQNI
jgi:hypothetical protein